MAKAESLSSVGLLTFTLGTALSQWAQVEQELFLLYLALCRPNGDPAAYTVIWRTLVHLDTKISVIDSLAREQFSGETNLDVEARQQWTTLHNALLKKKKSRNKLAHWTIHKDVRNGTEVAFLHEALTNPGAQFAKGFGKPHGGALYQPQLLDMANDFMAFAGRVRDFTNELALASSTKKLPPRLGRLPNPPPPQLAEDQTPAGHAHPPQSSEG